MHFGPLELQACGENNFTMKALGLLAFDRALRVRFVRKLLGDGAIGDGDDPTILFFSRIGEGFMREAIERERQGSVGDLEARLNRAAGLPEGFRWARKSDRRLVQAAKWHARHIDEMVMRNSSRDDGELQSKLKSLQDVLNTEPDLVLQWGNHLLLVEIKVLSGEGTDQIGRQRRLGAFFGALLGWTCSLRMIAPEGAVAPSDSSCVAVSWADVASWFDDVPTIAEYIRGFRFFYGGAWRSMVAPATTNTVATAFDLALARSPAPAILPAPQPPSASPTPPRSFIEYVSTTHAPLTAQPTATTSTRDPRSDPWHFAHLGIDYFGPIARGHRNARLAPIRAVWTGRKGVTYADKARGRQVNPNWMLELEDGTTCTKTSGFGVPGSYSKQNMHRWLWSDIVGRFGPML